MGQRQRGPSRLLSGTSQKARLCNGMGRISAVDKPHFHFCEGSIHPKEQTEQTKTKRRQKEMSDGNIYHRVSG